MNDEIKEILWIIKSCKQDYDKQKDGMHTFDYGELYLLYNYITNLQQENKEWDMIFDTFSSRPYAHRYLEEKRKELGNKRIIGLDSEMIYKDYYDYKARCEKAIEYITSYEAISTIQGLDKIEQNKTLDERTMNVMVERYLQVHHNLLNILQNGSDSQ